MRTGSEKYRAILESMPDAFMCGQVVTDDRGMPVDYLLLTVNPAFAAMSGRAREDLEGRHITEVLPEINQGGIDWVFSLGKVGITGVAAIFQEYFPPAGSMVYATAHSDEPGHVAVIFRTREAAGPADSLEVDQKDAFPAPWRQSLPDNTGHPEPEGRVGAGYAVKERQLRESEIKYRSIFENSPLGVLHFDQAGVLTACNDMFVSIIGSSRERLVGLDLLNLPDRKVAAAVQEALQGRRGFYEDNYHSVTSEKVTPVKAMFAPVMEGKGKVTGGVGIVEDITERKQVEEALRKSRRQYRDLVNRLNEGVGVSDVHETILFANPAADRIFGVGPGELEGKNVREFVTRENLQRVLEQTGKRKEGESGSYELEIVQPGGDVRVIAVSASPRFDEGCYSGSFVVFQDVTERKQAAQALRDERMRLANLVDATNAGTWEINLQTGETIINDRWAKILGYEKEELRNINIDWWFDKLHPDDYEITKIKMNRHVNGDADFYEHEVRLRHRDGRWIWVHGKGKIVSHTPEGSPLWMYGTDVDITERKQAQAEVEESKNLLQSIFESIQDGISVLDKELNIIRVNSAMERWYMHASPLEGQKCYQAFQGRETPCQSCPSLQSLERLEGCLEEVPLLQGEELKGWLEVYAYPLRDSEGQVKGVVEFVRDITARKQAEERVKYLSFHDSLTGLYNRAYLEEEMKRLDTERQLPISVIMADLNGLKLINDTYGHHQGDEMLRQAAALLRGSCRQEDLLARWGGDEFVILLPQTASREATAICHRITASCQEANQQDVPLSIALGLACKESMETELGSCLRTAEDQMYRQKMVESRSARSTVLKSLLETLEAKSMETRLHVQRMYHVALKCGQRLGLSDSELGRLGVLVNLHDVGKINISEDILTKKEPLTEAEWEIMKKHPETGYRITRAMAEFAHVAEDILAHHERWDGCGYPRGLQGEDIPVLARLVAIADAYEVMSYGRPYKRAMSGREIAAELERSSGSHFDPRMVEVFLEVMAKGEHLSEV